MKLGTLAQNFAFDIGCFLEKQPKKQTVIKINKY